VARSLAAILNLHADKDRDDKEIDARKDRAADVSGQGRPTSRGGRPLDTSVGPEIWRARSSHFSNFESACVLLRFLDIFLEKQGFY